MLSVTWKSTLIIPNNFVYASPISLLYEKSAAMWWLTFPFQ